MAEPSPGQLVGYALAARFPTLFANGEIMELIELFVVPDQRGGGIGASLVRYIEAFAANVGVVELTVPTRRASEFYLKLGFENTATFLKKKIAPSMPRELRD